MSIFPMIEVDTKLSKMKKMWKKVEKVLEIFQKYDIMEL